MDCWRYRKHSDDQNNQDPENDEMGKIPQKA